MAFTTRQAASEQKSAQEAAAKPSAQLFNDQRASTHIQLQQQQLMHSGQSPTQLAAEEEEPLQGKFVAQRVEEEEPLQGKFVAQRVEEEEPLQGKFDALQRVAEEEEPLQGKFGAAASVQREQKPNNTGLPDNVKSGIENLSGYSMDDVKVHYNSAKPAELNAHAYAQGTDIHVAPGQEKHLPHEAWHVVQQKQGRVQPTMQMKAGVPVNDDAGLENEADVMGAKAVSIQSKAAAQLKIKMKDSGPAERTDKSGPALQTEVQKTISRGDQNEIESDIKKLETSIENRTNNLKGYSENSIEYGKHQARIELEQSLLSDLKQKNKSLKKQKAKKKKVKETVKTTVTTSKPTSKFSNNPFSVLMNN